MKARKVRFNFDLLKQDVVGECPDDCLCFDCMQRIAKKLGLE